MATVIIDTGGDADFGTGLWPVTGTSPAIVSDFVTNGHLRSIQFHANATDQVGGLSLLADTGRRLSLYVYFTVLPNAGATFISFNDSTNTNNIIRIRLSATGALQLWDNTRQRGTDGMVLQTGKWYRISFAYVITSTTVNDWNLWVNGINTISIHNELISNTTTASLLIGNNTPNAVMDFRVCDIYLDNSNANTDPGNILTTAKRPNANGTTNGYTTQIGAGGSGYGTGHSPQVNERPNSDTNGWSIVTVASAITEEYNIESKIQGDINITSATIVDYMGWVRTKALNAETAKIIVNNVQTSISVTTSAKVFTQIAGSSTYPAGTGTDIGEVSAAIATTISLYECGIVFAYTPIAPTGFAAWADNTIALPNIGNDVQIV